ncbi:unnamed protein product [Miscanthus lutarioriparius]|uniref:Uncharacterized protein n=1 Tax=Miscanthus lutarioriparius TaxID=422564 RepID=A0A811QRU4_9POAL|nr:unnamed protein product [Miscanthus lutarioriparius]
MAMAVARLTSLACTPRQAQHRGRHSLAPPRASGAVEVRVCTNRTCARQGGREVLAALAGLAPPRVDVGSCGCLRRCGAGAQRRGVRRRERRGEKAKAALEKGNADEAEALLTEVIGSNACGGLHLVYKSRSKARLAMGDISGALEDAEEAIRIAPRFPQAHLLRGDALFAMGEYSVAEDAYADALDLDPSIRRSKSFRARAERLREKLVSANNP